MHRNQQHFSSIYNKVTNGVLHFEIGCAMFKTSCWKRYR